MGKLSIFIVGILFFLSLILVVEGCDNPKTVNKAPDIIVNEAQFGVNIHFTGNHPTDIELMKNAGLKVVRTDMSWSNIETKMGNYEFKLNGYDELTHSLIQNNLRPLYILNYSNSLYEKERSIVTDIGREAFNRYVEHVTKRYSGNGILWEVWNEPNGIFWNPKPSVEAYSLLLKSTSETIKRNDPSGIVVAPALSGVNSDSILWLEELYKRGAMENVDAVSVHPYRGGSPETVINDYKLLRNMMRKYTKKEIPILSGEWGYPVTKEWRGQDIDETKQAEYLVRMFLINIYQKIPISIWYDWKNDGDDPKNAEHNFGLLGSNNNTKISYQSLKTLNDTLNGYNFNKRLEYGQTQDYIFQFTSGTREKILVFWTSGINHYATISLPSGKGELVTMLGQSETVKWNQDQVTLNFTSSPNYLIIK